MKKIYFFLAMALCIAACHNHEETTSDGVYDASIQFVSPKKDAIFLVNAFVNVEILFERPENAVIHNVNISILDSTATNVVAILKQGHIHTKSPFTFKDNSFKATKMGKFYIKAITTDDADKQPKELIQPFFIK